LVQVRCNGRIGRRRPSRASSLREEAQSDADLEIVKRGSSQETTVLFLRLFVNLTLHVGLSIDPACYFCLCRLARTFGNNVHEAHPLPLTCDDIPARCQPKVTGGPDHGATVTALLAPVPGPALQVHLRVRAADGPPAGHAPGDSAELTQGASVRPGLGALFCLPVYAECRRPIRRAQSKSRCSRLWRRPIEGPPRRPGHGARMRPGYAAWRRPWCGSYSSDRARGGYCRALRPTPSGSGQCSEEQAT
jgi:hypothetical protein